MDSETIQCSVTDYYSKKVGPCWTFKKSGDCLHVQEASEPFIGPRSEARPSVLNKPGGAFTRSWSRTINHKRFSFSHIAMPDGEIRWSVSVYNGYGDDGTEWGRKSGMRFGCAWSPHKFITFRPNKNSEPEES